MRVQDTVADELPYARVHARTPAKSTAHSATITGHSCKPVETQATCSEAASMLTVEQKHARWQELLCQTLDVSDCGHTRALLGPATHLNALDTALCTQYPTAPKKPNFQLLIVLTIAFVRILRGADISRIPLKEVVHLDPALRKGVIRFQQRASALRLFDLTAGRGPAARQFIIDGKQHAVQKSAYATPPKLPVRRRGSPLSKEGARK